MPGQNKTCQEALSVGCVYISHDKGKGWSEHRVSKNLQKYREFPTIHATVLAPLESH